MVVYSAAELCAMYRHDVRLPRPVRKVIIIIVYYAKWQHKYIHGKIRKERKDIASGCPPASGLGHSD